VRPEALMTRRSFKTAARLLGLAVLAFVVWRNVDLRELLGNLAAVSPAWIAGLWLVASVDRVLMAAKWRHLCGPLEIRAPLREWVGSYYAASFLTFFLPTSLGGDVYRGWRLTRASSNGSGVVASLIMEKLVGVVAVVTFAWVGLGYLVTERTAPESQTIFLVLLFASAAAFLALLVSLSPTTHRLLDRFQPVAKLSVAYAEFANHRGTLLANTMLAIVEAATRLVVTCGAAFAIGLDVAVGPLFAIVAVTEFIRRCTIVLDGWGLSESIRIVTYGLVGISGGDALAIGVVSHAIMGLASLPGAFFFFGDRSRHDVPRASGPPSRARKMVQRFLLPQFVISVWYWIGSRSTISPRAEVELSPNLHFGRRCTVSSFTKIKAEGPLHIGRRSGFATGCFVSSGLAGITVGDHVLVGPNVSIVGSKYVHRELDVPFEDQGHESKGIRIGSNVWIGAGSVVADGAVIGDNTIVAAGSLVTRRYPSNVIISGSPAKVILRRDRQPGGQECVNKSSKSSAAPSPISTKS
jgi:acetyltransferase-like isoleucine patch superfamily enzyme/uncharacterized membrane protein YbhN (UPF0104 family)